MNDGSTETTRESRHEPHPSIAAYALGVLDADERVALEAHLAGCATCRAELDRQQDVVGKLGYLATPVAPRPDLRARLLAEIGAAGPEPRGSAVHPQLVPARWLAVAAAVAVATIAMLGFFLNQTLQERDDARDAGQEIAEYLANGGILSPLQPAPGAPSDVASGHGSLAVAPDQSGAMLVVYGLPPTSEDQRYVAWAERDGDRVELGELTVNDQGVGSLTLYGPEPIATYETVGITRHSPDAPEGEPFLVATVE